MVPRSLVAVVAVVIAAWLAVGRGGGGDDLGAAGPAAVSSGPDARAQRQIEDARRREIEDARRRLGSRADFRIPPAAIARKNANDIWWTVIERVFHEFLGEPYNSARFDVLTTGQRALYVIHMIEAELYNGGFHQLYSNSTGDLADEAPAALHRIGAGAHAGVFERANATLTRGGGTVPGGQPARWRLLERLGETDLDRFDDAWYDLGDGTGRSVLARRAAAYVRAHPGEFLAGAP